ncbi:MAG TPA: DUF4214 domain-containing protein, partial [Burkholderiaceae bacterium]
MGINTAALQNLYIAYFGRPADAGGLKYWEGELAAGKSSLTVIRSDFGKSSEFVSQYTGMNDGEIVTRIFQNLFGRVPDPGGLTYWQNQLATKQSSLSDLVLAVGSGAQGSDATALKAKVDAAIGFTDAIGASSLNVNYSDS